MWTKDLYATKLTFYKGHKLLSIWTASRLFLISDIPEECTRKRASNNQNDWKDIDLKTDSSF